jgi:hypothetical protein
MSQAHRREDHHNPQAIRISVNAPWTIDPKLALDLGAARDNVTSATNQTARDHTK